MSSKRRSTEESSTNIAGNVQKIEGSSIKITGNVNKSAIVQGNVEGDLIIQASAGDVGAVDLDQLADDLSRLRAAMRQAAQSDEHDVALGEVAQAERAARAKNLSAVLAHLRAAGAWALDVATKIGVPVTVEVIKKALGIK
ncbi:MAG: hypothetical protein RML95_13240 [Anaerolineae bacterium]|nr:hypothetical protein [Anaerolineae bacterium]